MRKRGASGGGTLRRKSPQQGQRPSLPRGVVASGAALTWVYLNQGILRLVLFASKANLCS